MNTKNKLFIIIATVIVIFGAIMLFKSKSSSVPEPAIARMDISTKLVDANKPQFEVYVDGSETAEKQAAWMPTYKVQGYVVQKEANEMNVVVKSLTDSTIKVNLRGPDKRDANNELVPVWVKYTSVKIDGDEILSEPVNVWHNKPFAHNVDVKAGGTYNITAKWQVADPVSAE